MHKKLYLDDTYLSESPAVITYISQDDRGCYVVLDQTIFYPQGGGQPSDQGQIKCEEFSEYVTHVRQNENEIRHYVDALLSEQFIGLEVLCQLDYLRRMINARYHTAAHLLGNVVECLYPELKATKGHSFPNEAYVEFMGTAKNVDGAEILQSLNQVVSKDEITNIFHTEPVLFEKEFYKLPYVIPSNKIFRVMQIGSYLPVPCGGTHVSNISEIKNIELGKIKVKNESVHISYRLT